MKTHNLTVQEIASEAAKILNDLLPARRATAMKYNFTEQEWGEPLLSVIKLSPLETTVPMWTFRQRYLHPEMMILAEKIPYGSRVFFGYPTSIADVLGESGYVRVLVQSKVNWEGHLELRILAPIKVS